MSGRPSSACCMCSCVTPQRAFHRSQLLDRVWGRDVYVEERTVDVHVLRLRKALMPYGMDKVVETVRGVGYRLAPEVATGDGVAAS